MNLWDSFKPWKMVRQVLFGAIMGCILTACQDSKPSLMASPTVFNLVTLTPYQTLAAEHISDQLDNHINTTSEVNLPGLAPTPLIYTATVGDASSGNSYDLQLSQPVCYFMADEALWCFVAVRHEYTEPLESITGLISITNLEDGSVVSQPAFMPLERLLPGKTLPLMSYFPPPLPLKYEQPVIELKTALPGRVNDERFVTVDLASPLIVLNRGGNTATIRGELHMIRDEQPAQWIGIAAIAYDMAGNIVGIRKWQTTETLIYGASLPVEFQLFSLVPSISAVDIQVEARP